MRRQKGSLMLYGALGAGLVIVALGIALKVQSARLDSLRAEYDGFKAQVAALGEIAKREKAKKEAKDKATKEAIDRETKTLRDSNAVLAKRLRDERASRGFLPRTGSPANRPDAITFDRAKLERAIQQLDHEVSSIIARGDQAVIDLNLSLKWAKEISAR